MKDATLEYIALISIIIGLALCFLFIFDYEPKDAFFLESDDDNAMLEGKIIHMRISDNYTLIQVYSCKEFSVYSNEKIEKSVNDNITIKGSFSDNLFIVEKYY